MDKFGDSNMSSTTNRLSMYKGNNASWQFNFTDQDGGVQSLAGATIICSFKKKEIDDIPVIQLKSSVGPAEIQIDDESGGLYTIKLIPSHTSGLNTGVYYYDIEVKISGRTETVLKDYIEILLPITI